MLTDLYHYQQPDASLWQGRKDSLSGERFFQKIKLLNAQQGELAFPDNHYVLLGFCSDEGIRRNEGRVGAKTGPIALREQLGKLPYHGNAEFIDMGNIICEGQELEDAQLELAKLISFCHQQHQKTLVLGGGHETAWGHFMGLQSHYPNLGIINFDAHFDLRLPVNEQSTSGTPFRQIAHFCELNQRPFSYCCVGIQDHANTNSLFKAAKELNVSYLKAETIHQSPLEQQHTFLDTFLQQHSHIYLSICLDVLAESCAPGVSAPQALGLQPWQLLSLLQYVLQSGKVVSMDMVELSPPLDQHQQTARLGAMLLAELLET